MNYDKLILLLVRSNKNHSIVAKTKMDKDTHRYTLIKVMEDVGIVPNCKDILGIEFESSSGLRRALIERMDAVKIDKGDSIAFSDVLISPAAWQKIVLDVINQMEIISSLEREYMVDETSFTLTLGKNRSLDVLHRYDAFADEKYTISRGDWRWRNRN